MLNNYIIVFYSKGMESVIYKTYYNGRYSNAFEYAQNLCKDEIKSAYYFDIFTEKEYKNKFE